MTDRADRSMAVTTGSLVGVAVAAILYLVVEEVGTLYALGLPALAVLGFGFAWFLAKQSEVRLSRSWLLLSVALAIPSGYGSFRSFDRWLDRTTAPSPPPVTRTQLPGFSILIDAEAGRSWTDEYARGYLFTQGRIETAVFWTDDPLPADRDAAAYLIESFEYEKVTVNDPDREIPAGDLETRSFTVFLELDRTLATFVACGERVILVLSDGTPPSVAQRVHERRVATIECTPDPVEEATLNEPPPVTTTVPQGWERDTEFAPLWMHWTRGDASLIFMYFYRGGDSLGDPQRMVTDAIGEWGTVAMSGSEQAGAIELWKGTLAGEDGAQQVLARSMMCGRRPVLGVLFGWNGIEDARAALVAARCE